MPQAAEHARRVAEAVAKAWYSTAPSNNHIEVPLGVVAALALVHPLTAEGAHAIADRAQAGTDQDLADELEKLWAAAWTWGNPYLVDVARPLHAWIPAADGATLSGAKAVLIAALTAGIHVLTGDMDPAHRADADLLGHVLTALRAAGARQGLGEFHTPDDAVDLLNQLTLDPTRTEPDTRPGATFHDPAAGTGDLVRGAAQTLRQRGGEPATHTWVLADIDPLAAAACAINTIVWGLGPNVLVSCSNTLVTADAAEQEAAHRAEIMAHHDRQIAVASTIAATRRAMALLSTFTDDSEDGEAAA